MEIACVIDRRLAAPRRPGHSGGLRPGRQLFDDPGAGGADPVAAAELTEAMARALESVGAAVETERAGEIFFAVGGLRGLYGGDVAGVVAVVEGVLGTVHGATRVGGGTGAARAGGGASAAIGVAATRTAARAAAERGLPPVTPPRLAGFLGSLPTAVLIDRLGPKEREAEALVEALGRLGIETLGALRKLTADQVADRFGPRGLRAWRIARGEEEPLRPRVPHEELVEEIELPEGVAGSQLDRALELLVDRLLAAPARKGRTLLGVRLGARLCGGGSWSVDQGLGRPSAAAAVLRRLLVPRLESLLGPAEALRLRALGFGPAAADQLVMEVGGSEPRRRRLGAAVREVRAAQGTDALLRVLPVDTASRVPERRDLLTPFPEL
jgi:protein ImuB